MIGGVSGMTKDRHATLSFRGVPKWQVFLLLTPNTVKAYLDDPRIRR